MIDPRTLRGQLALAYAAALLVALVAFAALTLFVVDRTQRASLDARLSTALRAVTAIADAHDGKIVLDPVDRRQFPRVVGTRLAAALVTLSGRPIVATTSQLPDGAVQLAAGSPQVAQIATMRGAEGTLRVAMTRIPRQGPAAGIAIVWSDLDEIGEVDQRLAFVLAVCVAVFAALAVLVGGAVAARGLRPLDAIASIASEIEGHDLTRRLDLPPRDDELGRLAATFDRMLDRLEAAFARQRRFTSDASHELRAPLSVIRAEADLTLRRPRSSPEYERALRTIAAHADDLEALTRDLLAAARAESVEPPAGSVDAADVARDAVARVDALARAHGATICVGTDAATAYPVRGQGDALRRAVICVIHNALRYGKDGGTVDIRVARDAATVQLSIADDGAGFSAGALEHATERFWRDDPSRSPGTGAGRPNGAGLGLAIARSTIEAAGGTLRLANAAHGGALVVIVLPADPDPRDAR